MDYLGVNYALLSLVSNELLSGQNADSDILHSLHIYNFTQFILKELPYLANQ